MPVAGNLTSMEIRPSGVTISVLAHAMEAIAQRFVQ